MKKYGLLGIAIAVVIASGVVAALPGTPIALGSGLPSHEEPCSWRGNVEFHSEFRVEKIEMEDLVNIYQEFGIEEPAKGDAFDIRTYDEANDEIDRILELAALENVHGQIVGVLEYHGFQIVLIKQADAVLAVTEKGGKTTVLSLRPELLGSREDAKTVEQGRDYILERTSGVRLYRLEIPVPAQGISPLVIDPITVWHQGIWNVLGGQLILNTKGQFWIDFGESVEAILNLSSADAAAILFELCEYETYTEGQGTFLGQVRADALFARLIGPITTRFFLDGVVWANRYGHTGASGWGDHWPAFGWGCQYALPWSDSEFTLSRETVSN